MTDVNEDPVGDLVITGTLEEGETLTADSSGVSDEDGMNMTDETYQWYSGGVAIADATSSTYTLVNSDTGNLIQVSMTYNDTDGRATTILSANTTAIVGVDDNDPTSIEVPNQVVLEDASTTIDVSSYFSDDDPDACSHTRSRALPSPPSTLRPASSRRHRCKRTSARTR